MRKMAELGPDIVRPDVDLAREVVFVQGEVSHLLT